MLGLGYWSVLVLIVPDCGAEVSLEETATRHASDFVGAGLRPARFSIKSSGISGGLEQKVPDDFRLRIREFARDYAWGVMNEGWNPINLYGGTRWYERYKSLAGKWTDEKIPDHRMLMAYGYIDHDGRTFFLTKLAFDLLDQALPASIFISYHRSESSAFALLLVERMRSVGLDPFLDIKDLSAGGQWHAELQEGIQERDNFVCLVGPATLQSPYVRKEIQWAQQGEGIRILPVYHNGFKGDEHVPTGLPTDERASLDAFLTLQAFVVDQENPKDYRSAIDELLNAFGYVP